METLNDIQKMVEKLPPELRQEVEDFIAFLAQKKTKRIRRKPSFKWAGALKDLQSQYTSEELQHKISEWRVGKE